MPCSIQSFIFPILVFLGFWDWSVFVQDVIFIERTAFKECFMSY